MLYAVSCAPGALWQDSGLIQYRVWHGDIEGFLGLALAHPLYYFVAIGAKHFPLGGFGHRVNLVSAVAGAIAVANLYLLVRLWLGKEFPAAVAAATLALSHTFWQHASIAETYTLWAALFLAELIVLLRYTQTRSAGYLYLLALLNGLAIAVHMLAIIPLVCYIVLVMLLLAQRRLRGRDVACIAGLWILGALPYAYLIVRDMAHSGDILGTFASAAFGSRWRADVLNTSLSWKIVKESVLLLGLNFPTPNVLLFFVGVCALRRIGVALAFRAIVLVLLALFFIFAFRYTIPDRYAFFIPFYCLAAAMIGLGSQAVRSRFPGKVAPIVIGAFVLLPVIGYVLAPALAQRLDVPIGIRHDVPCRNDYEYFLRPWKTGYAGADRFAREALEAVERDAIIWADITTAGPLLYVQEVQGIGSDVNIVSSTVCSEEAPSVTEPMIEILFDHCPIYVVSARPGYCPAFILNRYHLVKTGVLWRLVE